MALYCFPFQEFHQCEFESNMALYRGKKIGETKIRDMDPHHILTKYTQFYKGIFICLLGQLISRERQYLQNSATVCCDNMSRSMLQFSIKIQTIRLQHFVYGRRKDQYKDNRRFFWILFI
jgi:hypothetical protein